MYKYIAIIIAVGAMLTSESLLARGGGRVGGGRAAVGARGGFRGPTMSRARPYARGAVAGAAVANNRNANNYGGYATPDYYYPTTPYYSGPNYSLYPQTGYPPN